MGRLGTRRPTAAQVRRGVAQVLGEPSFAAAAARVRAEMAAHDAGREGAALLERLATTGAPVLREGVPAG